MKLGDVLKIRNGLTVEVLNTDAEGRLVLADVLSEAVERKPARIIDLATLTGACLVALGTKTAGLFANDDTVANDVLAAAKSTGERAWRMPMDDDYGDLIKSKVAEIKNTGGKWGGAITAAKFLQRFVDKTPWVHLDIAGPSWAHNGAIITVRNMDEAAELSNRIAPEHLEISAAEPQRWEPLLRHAGAIFMGAYTSESLGDYCAGPNHVLPTAGTARFSSPLGVYDFQKRSSLIEVSEAGAQVLGPIAAELAHGEGLQAHARAAELRLRAGRG